MPRILKKGACYNITGLPIFGASDTTCTDVVPDVDVNGAFTVEITGLTKDTAYYVRAYATNSAGTGYGEQRMLDTATKPIVVTSDVSKYDSTTATGGGIVTEVGTSPVTARGVCWSSKDNPPTLANRHTTDKITGDSTFHKLHERLDW